MSKNGMNIAGRSVVLIAVLISVWSGHYGKAEIYPSIFWTPHNPIFSTGVTPSNELNVFPYSRLHIVCPKAWTILTTLKNQVSKNELYQNIWRVDEASYQTCSARAAQKLLECKSPQPQTIEYVTFEFKYPAVSKTTFPPGKEYFFIATSNGTRRSLNSTSGGHCSTHNMKFKVYVCRDNKDVRCSITATRTTRKPMTTQSETGAPENEIVSGGVAKSASFNERNGTDFTSKPCNNTAFGTKSETEPLQKTKIFVCSVAILASVAAISIALNAILLWQLKCKNEENKQRAP